MTLLTDDDLYLFNEGSHLDLGRVFGAQPRADGTHFAVWAPDAVRVSVAGDFNGWDQRAHPLAPLQSSGVWVGMVPEAGPGTRYKYHLRSRFGRLEVLKADPVGHFHELAPSTASIVWDLGYEWGDDEWMGARKKRAVWREPMSIYELHLGSWRRPSGNPSGFLTYAELAEILPSYLVDMGFTHVEFLPVMEHPFYGSWGYQTTGYFAPTSRYGTPQDLKTLIDALHQSGIGVILDWVPSHFPMDEHGLANFDGTHLYEHADPRRGFHPDWKSAIFNYGRNEVQSFLLSSAHFWLDEYHVDGLRVDAVASMLYLDYSRADGEWIPNAHGGRENLEAIAFLRRLNTTVYDRFPDAHTAAEESTAWPMVSRPVHHGGLGFGMKWDMGWMHDTLKYLERDPIHRRFHQNEITFRAVYQFTENFVLPLSHDEVVHLKRSLLEKMPGDEWQKFANLRLLLTNQWLSPGKPLLFMGGELAVRTEWNHDTALDWRLLEHDSHAGVQRLVRTLNRLKSERAALHERDFAPEGFEWIAAHDTANSVLSFVRWSEDDCVVCVFNATPTVHEGYRIGAPLAGAWREIFNSDAAEFGGSGVANDPTLRTTRQRCDGRPQSLTLRLAPLSGIVLAPVVGPSDSRRRQRGH